VLPLLVDIALMLEIGQNLAGWGRQRRINDRNLRMPDHLTPCVDLGLDLRKVARHTLLVKQLLSLQL